MPGHDTRHFIYTAILRIFTYYWPVDRPCSLTSRNPIFATIRNKFSPFFCNNLLQRKELIFLKRRKITPRQSGATIYSPGIMFCEYLPVRFSGLSLFIYIYDRIKKDDNYGISY